MRRKKHERKHKKRIEGDPQIDEEKLAKLKAIKSKRDETIAMVKLDLEEKFNKRFAITRANMLKEEHDRQKKLRDESKSLNEKRMIEIREEMKKVMSVGVETVHAGKILEDKVKFDVKSSTITILGKKHKIKKNVHIVGWGLEALMMSSTFEKLIGDHLKRGWLVVPRRTISRMSTYPEWYPRLNTRIIFSEAGSDKKPDEGCVAATKNIVEYCKKLKKTDILIVVLSAGADNLLCLPKGTIGLREKVKLLDELREAGATTREIELVRRSLSAVRGGELARSAYPAKVISLVMSDAGPDDLHLKRMSGGPTINSDMASTRSSVQRILEKYALHDHKLSQSIREVLSNHKELASPNIAEVSKMVDENKRFKFVSDCVVASSNEAVNAMAVTAFRLGYSPIKLVAASSASSMTEAPNVRKVIKEYTKIISLLILGAENKITRTEVYEQLKESKIFDISEKKLLEIFPSKDKWARGLYIIIGAPPISAKPNVNDNLTSGNKTGKNQELALYFSLYWYLRSEQYPILKKYVVWFLGCASTGQDGNTDYAGAYGYGNLGVDVFRQYKAEFLECSKAPVEPDDSAGGKVMIPTENKGSTEGFQDKRRAIHEAILPDRVLATGNANLLFLNVNEGEELLQIGNATGNTFTNVGDLHLFRIVRYQCNCDGLCLNLE